MGFIRPKQDAQYKPWHGWLFMAVVFIAVVLGIAQRVQPREEIITPEVIEPVIMSKTTCEESGGEWNSCGSACRGSDENCIQVCVVQCECVTSEECPAGFTCGDFLENKGICLSTSQQ